MNDDTDRIDSDDESIETNRRTILQYGGAAVAGVAGLAATTGSAAADTDEIMEVDLRGGISPVTDAPQGEDEVIFNVHGYTGSSASVSQSETLQSTLREFGNTETVTAVTWDDSGLPSSAESSARQQGADFADWMEEYIQANPGTTIRVLGHSMGGIVAFEFMAAAAGRFQVANVDSIGSYEVSDAPCEGTEFHDAIDQVATFAGNYYSTNDSIARLGNGPADCGFGGGSLPDNYADVDVSDSVGSHTTYKSSTGFGQAYISNFQPGVDRNGDGDDGDNGDGGEDAAPTIDSLSVDQRSYWGNDITVEWSVSDANGDLSSVQSVVFGSSSNRLDSTRTSVSGPSASGTHELDPPFYNDGTYVRVRVTDAAGNDSTRRVRL
ncbi:esterase/lipase family protein [Haloterrigena alkaliphila]|uniref:Alpha/beta hydrolase n=1 Tax=Haloterrigena alkaliphila TaxID=2816475 RepID=A0A8A2VEJ9_9EURY|nr:alpha/beta hydrolase [Haloterrigena alkaliphila]QSW99686.1 alpha/beta hydrolase [Haloterrigena alkaliphila]